MFTIRQALATIRERDEGATAVEYAVMVALIAAVIIVAVVALGNNASSALNCTASAIETGSGDCGPGSGTGP